jgi:hypothetical protein
MHIRARFLQSVGELGHLTVKRIDIKSFSGEFFGHCDEVAPGPVHLRGGVMKIIRRGAALGIVFRELAMTIATQCARSCCQHLVVCPQNRVIAMAFAAFGPFMLVERLFVFAAVEQTGVGRMTKTAASTDVRDARGSGGVITVATCATRRAEIAAREGLTVNTGPIFGELIGRQRRTVGFR